MLLSLPACFSAVMPLNTTKTEIFPAGLEKFTGCVGQRLPSVRPGFDPRSGHAGKSYSGWPGRYTNVRFFLYACTGLQVTEGMKCPAHFGYT